MAGLLAADVAFAAGTSSTISSGKLEEPDHSSSNWYFEREEIESNSPSRKDGIDLKKETYLRKSYCTFLQDLGMRLKVPQVTIATAIVFCHRFFLRQSHQKNDRLMIATICMFLAGKVEETPRGLIDVILISYEIRFKKDQAAISRIKQYQKKVIEEQKELVLVGERLVLTTLGFDLNIHHPYKPLVAAIKKFKVAQNALAQVAWNFVNDGLRTSLCLQFKPHHIAAGAIFLAAKFLKVKLPSDGDKVWWQEFDVTPRQLEEVSNQMLELYEPNKAGGTAGAGAASRSSEPSISVGGPGSRHKTGQMSQSQAEAPPSANGHHSSSRPMSERINKVEDGAATSRADDDYEAYSARHTPTAASTTDTQKNGLRMPDYEPGYENGAAVGGKGRDGGWDGFRGLKPSANGNVKEELSVKAEAKQEHAGAGTPEEGQIEEERREEERREQKQQQSLETWASNDGKVKTESVQLRRKVVKAEINVKAEYHAAVDVQVKRESESKQGLEIWETKDFVDRQVDEEAKVKVEVVGGKAEAVEDGRKQWVGFEELNKDKVKAALARRKSRGEGGEIRPKLELADDDELLERALESDMEVVGESEKGKHDRRELKTKHGHRVEHDLPEVKKERAEDVEGASKRKRLNDEDMPSAERRRAKSIDKGDATREGEVGKVDSSDVQERGEDGELPTTSLQEQPRSPKGGERRPLLSTSSDRGGSSPAAVKRRWENREQHGRGRDRDANHEKWVDNRSMGNAVHRHGHTRSDAHYHSHQHHQYRSDGDRDRYHQRDRDWQEREHKKPRHDHGH